MIEAATDTGTSRPHTPSVSELQAALLATRSGQFATASERPALAKSRPGPAVTGRGDPAVVAASPPDRPSFATAPPGGQGVWLLGTHGGSGVRCLSAVLPGTRCAGKSWPTPRNAREPVVLVCRGNHRGLTAAQEYARAYRDVGLAEHVALLGVIVSADAPGRPPLPLRRLQQLLSGAVPVLGHAPWEPTWRLGPPQPGARESLAWVATLGDALAAAAGRAVSA